MTEEEKKAIEDLRKILFQTMQANECGLSTNDFKDEIKTYTDILNLIEKLLEENEEYYKALKNYGIEIDLEYIPKSKIKKKIEELEKAGTTETRNNKNEVVEQHYFLQDEIDVLKELLEEE